MRSLGVLLALMAVCAAGPVGAYLGFNVDRQETSDHHGRDSIHFLIGGDSVLHRASVETTTVVSETTRLGLPAWILR
ncbi:hypothetical protein FJY71_08400, partial [candidate division WOR-3 bacterium]|nr:hypothetical protein [candidate division WOR-3 bacterium]